MSAVITSQNTLPTKISCDIYKLTARVCKESFWQFVRNFWDQVPGSQPLQVNWHMEYLCNELQEISERIFKGKPKKHDLLVNISPNSSKSSICSILYPAWNWTRMPGFRHIIASHTDTLVLDLATKSRSMIEGELYQRCFPEIKLKKDQDTKGYFANTYGGDRVSCTVGGKSPTGFHSHATICDDLIDPQKVLSEAELKTASDFPYEVLMSRKVDKKVSVFIAIMQRLHPRDPSAVIIEKSKTEGADPLKHICLPAEEADNISPPELREKYIDGLMDPVRLSREALAPYRNNKYVYAGQFMQMPTPKGGGMFQSEWFSRRCKASPRNSQRIRYWDKAATIGPDSCYTAGVLVSRDSNGEFYVEHVVHGQWESVQRNKKIKATALRDRTRYGPKYEPIIVIEAEGGASGRDAWKDIVRILAGYVVKEDRPTGSKDTRAEVLATQLEAGSVILVEDTTWDINKYIQEFENFRPMPGKRISGYADQVDATTGAVNILAGLKKNFCIKVYDIQPRKKKGLRIVVCSQEELFLANIKSHPCLLISLKDPSPREIKLQGRSDTLITIGTPAQEILPREPTHSIESLLGSLTLEVPNLDPKDFQERWEEEILPYQEKPEKLIMSREHGKKLWAFILAKRASSPEVLVFCDDGDGRALSLALGVCDTLRFARKSTIYLPGKPEDTLEGVLPPNEHIYQITKKTRNMIVA